MTDMQLLTTMGSGSLVRRRRTFSSMPMQIHRESVVTPWQEAQREGQSTWQKGQVGPPSLHTCILNCGLIKTVNLQHAHDCGAPHIGVSVLKPSLDR